MESNSIPSIPGDAKKSSRWWVPLVIGGILGAVYAIAEYRYHHQTGSQTRLPRETAARIILHSTYLKEDTRGRPHSFMSHLLVFPKLDTATAAESWGADEWPTEEYA